MCCIADVHLRPALMVAVPQRNRNPLFCVHAISISFDFGGNTPTVLKEETTCYHAKSQQTVIYIFSSVSPQKPAGQRHLLQIGPK